MKIFLIEKGKLVFLKIIQVPTVLGRRVLFSSVSSATFIFERHLQTGSFFFSCCVHICVYACDACV